MSEAMAGIHHVTALAGEPQRNLDFYAGLLGLRLVKRTVNFDDPGTYHLYYGDETGRPGTILTFFPWPYAKRGRRGTGQATVTGFSVPSGSLPWWRERLTTAGAAVEDGTVERFGDEVLTVLDLDGLKLELVAHAGAEALPPWADGPVEEAYALRGFHGVTLRERQAEATARLLEEMGFAAAGEVGERHRFVAPESGTGVTPGRVVDLVVDASGERGVIAAGTVHHVAFRANDDADQLAWRRRLVGLGLQPTPVLDRQYFHSIYFREPGGVLFELATDPPGFTVDETVAELGSHLRLPPWLESRRDDIEATLPPLESPQVGEGR